MKMSLLAVMKIAQRKYDNDRNTTFLDPTFISKPATESPPITDCDSENK